MLRLSCFAIILTCLPLLIICQGYCQYYKQCYSACLYNYCEYDPWNPDSVFICCYGCAEGYVWDPDTRQCAPGRKCRRDQDGNQLYWNFKNSSCVRQCPRTENTTVIFLYADPYTKTCSANCTYGFYRDPVTRTCKKQCSPDHITMQPNCSSTCYASANVYQYWYQSTTYIYGDDQIGRCVQLKDCSYNSVLQAQTYADNSSHRCTPKCVPGSYAHPDINVCVQQCFGDYPFANEHKWMCVQTLQQRNSFNDEVYQAIQPYLSAGANQTNIKLGGTQSSLDKTQTHLQVITVVFAILIAILIIAFVIYACYMRNKISAIKNAQILQFPQYSPFEPSSNSKQNIYEK